MLRANAVAFIALAAVMTLIGFIWWEIFRWGVIAWEIFHGN